MENFTKINENSDEKKSRFNLHMEARTGVQYYLNRKKKFGLVHGIALVWSLPR